VTSHEYLERHGKPADPQALANHECLRFAYGGPHREARQVWTFRDGDAQERVEVRGHLIANNPDVLFEAVLAGRGIALMPEWLVAPEIGAGRLLRLFENVEVNPHAGDAVIYAAYLPNRRHSSKVRTFVQFLAVRVQTPTAE
jgi:DNA-binding transcriptional LysR family regulator